MEPGSIRPKNFKIASNKMKSLIIGLEYGAGF